MKTNSVMETKVQQAFQLLHISYFVFGRRNDEMTRRVSLKLIPSIP